MLHETQQKFEVARDRLNNLWLKDKHATKEEAEQIDIVRKLADLSEIIIDNLTHLCNEVTETDKLKPIKRTKKKVK